MCATASIGSKKIEFGSSSESSLCCCCCCFELVRYFAVLFCSTQNYSLLCDTHTRFTDTHTHVLTLHTQLPRPANGFNGFAVRTQLPFFSVALVTTFRCYPSTLLLAHPEPLLPPADEANAKLTYSQVSALLSLQF
jgi:hypothetical protein